VVRVKEIEETAKETNKEKFIEEEKSKPERRVKEGKGTQRKKKYGNN
jgi:hypothetical protein